MKQQPTVGIYTLGCKVNQYESEAIAEAFRNEGFVVLPPSARADLYIINTCTVTAESDRKARQFIRRAIHQNPDALVFVTGCFSQVRPEDVAKIEGVDYICGNAEKLSVVAVSLKKKNEKKKASPVISVPSLESAPFEAMQIASFDRTRAYVKIEDGCENKCAYCIIPSARGPVRSKPIADVVEEVSTLTAAGCPEVVLTGIEIASYGKDLENTSLPDLLEALDRIPGIGRIRLGSLDPSVAKQEFVDRLAKIHSLAPHFHLSLQSGSDKVLAAMKRKYNAKQAMEAMERLKKAFPDAQFTTDIIVGFPGEDEEEFEKTLHFAEKACFLMIHVFPYSRRRGTVADRLPEQVPEEIKHERASRLAALRDEVRATILQSEVGKIYPVLFETDEKGEAIGHTPNFLEVRCKTGVPLHGKTYAVRLVGTSENELIGALLPERIEKT